MRAFGAVVTDAPLGDTRFVTAFGNDKLEFIELFLFILFLLLQEKYQKKQSQGALKAALPRVPYDRNYGMLATGKHRNLDSLRGAPPPLETPVRIAVGAGVP